MSDSLLLVLVLAILLLLLTACTTATELLDREARKFGLTRQVLKGTVYQHVAYQNAFTGNTFHIYLDGDGTPWSTRFIIAADPTPRNPLVLQLMAQDDTPSLYLGRPCYHGLAAVSPCSPLLWTSRRYGPEVVDSMAAALAGFLTSTPYAKLVFIGYSGGAALAMLLAERFATTRGVLTVAGNLDPDRWAVWHNYTPLHGSLNPAIRPPLSSAILQMHYAGGRDINIPTHLIHDVVSMQRSAKLIVVEDYDHVCCWEATWPIILARWQAGMKR
jgi:hypothetical protein